MWPVTRRMASLCHSTVVTMEYDGLVAGAMSPSCYSWGQAEVEVKPERSAATGRPHPSEHQPK
jgi:hypothetical protein